jgi:hypothetical protein
MFRPTKTRTLPRKRLNIYLNNLCGPNRISRIEQSSDIMVMTPLDDDEDTMERAIGIDRTTSGLKRTLSQNPQHIAYQDVISPILALSLRKTQNQLLCL